MAVTDLTVEGIFDDTVWYHYDVLGDVLYLQLLATRGRRTVGEDVPEGYVLHLDEETDKPVGITLVYWWKHHGEGQLPDSLHTINANIKPWAEKLIEQARAAEHRAHA